MFSNIENLRIYYEIIGSDGKNALLIHGWGIDSSSLKSLAKNLSNNFKVTSLDLPGFGLSEGIDQFDSYKLAEIVEKLILKLNMKISLIIGHSLGAKVAAILASKGYGEKLVLIGSPGIIQKKGFALKFKTYLIKIVKFLLTKVFFIREESRFFKRLRGKVGSSDYKNSSEEMKTSFKTVISEDLSEIFSKIKIKTLIVQGTKDRQVPLEGAYKIKSLIRNSKLVIIENADHFCYNNTNFLKELNQFLNISV